MTKIEIPDRRPTVDKLLQMLRERMDTQYPKSRAGKRPEAADADALAFMCGAAAMAHALGLDDTHSVTGLAFLTSVRSVDEILKEGTSPCATS